MDLAWETRVTSTWGRATVLGPSAEPFAVKIPAGLTRVCSRSKEMALRHGSCCVGREAAHCRSPRPPARTRTSGRGRRCRRRAADDVRHGHATGRGYLDGSRGCRLDADSLRWVLRPLPPARDGTFSAGKVAGGPLRDAARARQTVTFVERGKDMRSTAADDEPRAWRARLRAASRRFVPAHRRGGRVERHPDPDRDRRRYGHRLSAARSTAPHGGETERRRRGALASCTGAVAYRVFSSARRYEPLAPRWRRASVARLALRVAATRRERDRAGFDPGGRPGRPAHASVAPLPSIALPRVVSRAHVRADGLVGRCVARADGVCTLTVRLGTRLVAYGEAPVRYGDLRPVRARLTAAGRAALGRGATLLRVTSVVPGVDAQAITVRLR